MHTKANIYAIHASLAMLNIQTDAVFMIVDTFYMHSLLLFDYLII